MSRRQVHYSPAGTDRALLTSSLTPACLTPATGAGLMVTAAKELITCRRCERHAAGLVKNLRGRTVALPAVCPWNPQLTDGASKWGHLHGRYWRVWPLPGRDAGWQLEEVQPDGEPVGHATVVTREDGTRDVAWQGGYYATVRTLQEARELIDRLVLGGAA